MAALKAPPVAIKEMILKGEDNAITEDALRQLIRLVPKDEEIELLMPFKNQPPEGTCPFVDKEIERERDSILSRVAHCILTFLLPQCFAPLVKPRSSTWSSWTSHA